MGPWEPWAVDARRRALTHSPRPPRYLLLLTSHSGSSNIPSHKTNPAPVSLVDPAQFEYSENVNPRYFFPNKAKFKPDTLSIAIGGIGSSLHLAGEQLKLMADVRILNVPYKGTAPALTDVLGGQVDMMFISLVTGTAQVRAGKLRAYGVTSAQRQPSFPDLPAIGEIVQDFESTAWFGVFGPAHLPADITNKLNAAIVAAMTNPGMREQLQNEGAMPVGNSAAEFAAFVRDDVQRWAPIVKQSGARPD
jgi:tripartite-type tricarboxylate transporter receptor subunit TctC